MEKSTEEKAAENAANLPPLTLKQIQRRFAKMRRWLIWMMGRQASIEGQATHLVGEILKDEARVFAQIRAEEAAAAGGKV